MSAGLLAAMIAVTTPPEIPQGRHPAIALVDTRVDDARRRRLTTNGIEVVVGASQLALGTWGLVALGDDGRGVRRLAVKNMVAGSATMALGVVFMALPSAVERLYRDPTYDALARHPYDFVAQREFETRWAELAGEARVLRFLSGSLTLATGVGVSSWGAASLAFDRTNSPNDVKAWGLATINAGLLLVASGVVDLAIRSPIEQALRDYRSGFRPRRVVTRVRAGSLTVSF